MASWVQSADPARSGLAVFRRRFSAERPGDHHFDYTADERCMIFLDGVRIAEGPERSTADFWHRAHAEFHAEPGLHVLTVRLWQFGGISAFGQCSVRPGFRIWNADFDFSGDWEFQFEEECEFLRPGGAWSVPPAVRTDADYNYGICAGEGGVWQPAVIGDDDRELFEPMLPPMRCVEMRDFYWKNADTVVIGHYRNLWPEYEFSGNGTITVVWKECVGEVRVPKLPEAYPYLPATPNVFTVTGPRVRWTDYRFQSGKSVEFHCTGTAKVESVRFLTAEYPMVPNVELADADPRRERLLKAAYNTLQCSVYETFMDCPFYEELQYEGDSRTEALSMFAVTGDSRPAKQALRAFFARQQPDGSLPCRAPSQDRMEPCRPGEDCSWLIPSYLPIAVQMLHDYALTAPGDREFIRSMLPAARRTMAYLARHRREDLICEVPGWNFIDWVAEWYRGIPPHAERGEGCTLNFLCLAAWLDLADLERVCGDPALAEEADALAESARRAIRRVFYDEKKGMFAEDAGHRTFSEHAQVWAALCGEGDCRTLETGTLAPTSIYFDFYYFEACRKYRCDALFRRRLERYLEMAESGMDTLPEEFQNWRSYCHGWSAHYLAFHYPRPAIYERCKERRVK